jgi:hypothetical protein
MKQPPEKKQSEERRERAGISTTKLTDRIEGKFEKPRNYGNEMLLKAEAAAKPKRLFAANSNCGYGPFPCRLFFA